MTSSLVPDKTLAGSLFIKDLKLSFFKITLQNLDQHGVEL